MFRNRTFKFLSNLILLMVFCTGQISAAPNNSDNKWERYSSVNSDATQKARDSVPVNVQAASTTYTAIAAGNDHSCALTASSGVKCWGSNFYRQLGDGTTTNRLTPVNVVGLTSGVSAIAIGGINACALMTSGGVKCWGYNGDGRLGDGTMTNYLTPVDVFGLTSGVTAIAVGFGHSCALTTSGGVKCWGNNTNGQLGDGTTTNRLVPVDVFGLTSGVTAIATGETHTCALTAIGGVKCWGWNGWSQLGDGTTTDRHAPVNVVGLTTGVASIKAGEGHTCALTTSGGAKCWGNNSSGQVGDGTTTNRLIPADVIGLTSGVAAISVGQWHTCALTTIGGAKCWGMNFGGYLGDGTTTNRLTPVDVVGLTSGVIAMVAGGYHTCAVTNGGGAKCWGSNNSGQLGDGTIADSHFPVDVIGSGITSPFLDLPFLYSNFSEASKGSNKGGYVNSWFDHTSPGNVDALDGLTTWYGPYLGGGNIGQTNCNSPKGGFGVRCYNGHNGIDFKHVTEEVLAAAPGVVWKKGYEQNGFGNYLYIDHQNCYASLYAHLKNAPSFVKGDSITNRQVIGIMGNTGLSLGEGSGVHLHFGLYFDPTCDGDFSDRIAVDPYGWSGNGPDPWTAGQSKYLWKYPYDMSQQSITNAGGNVSTPSGNLSVEIPVNAVASTITLDLLDTPLVSEPSATLRSSGSSFWLRVIEWLTGTNNLSMVATQAPTTSFDVPIIISVKYNPSNAPHIDFSQSKIKQWDENSQAWVDLQENNIDSDNFKVTAQTSLPGYFDLQAPLICPADLLEPNDNYDASSIVETNGELISNLFDITQDEDWFRFNALGGGEYIIQTTDLTSGVDTILEIYDTGGVTLLDSNDNGVSGNGSYLIWQAPQDGIYFARVRKATGSLFGCEAAYKFSVLENTQPTISSITRAGTSPTSAASVDFTVTFSEAVTDVDVSDFSLSTTGVSSSSVTGVTPVSASVYTVSVNTGSGNGTIRLDVLVSAAITDLEGTPLSGLPFTTGQIYTITDAPTFMDVSLTHSAWQYIEAIYNAGITGGCTTNPLNYCPNNTVTRAQMAIFLLRGIHGSSYTPPAVGDSTGFNDVPTTHSAAAWIKQLAAEGITGGCGGGNYCPNSPVTRAQMAIFLLRAKYGDDYVPPAASGTEFLDVPIGHSAGAWIEQLAAEGITGGCGGGNYCPNNPVTRAQMAIFLQRTFNLPLP